MSVVIVGGGIVGLSAAVHLRRLDPGASVTLFERERLGAGATGASAAGIGALTRPSAVRPLALASLRRWPELDRELEGDTGFRKSGALLLALDPVAWADAPAFAAAARAAGVDAEVVDATEVTRLVPAVTPEARGGVLAPSSGQAEPARTTLAFASAARRLGVTIREGEAVRAVYVAGDRARGVLGADGAVHAADAVIVAAGAWTAGLLGPLGVDFPLEGRALQALLTAPGPAALRPVLGAFGQPISLRQREDGAYLIAGGWPARILDAATNRTEPLDTHVARNRALAAELFPPVGALPLAEAWAGLEAFTPDELPVLGPAPGIEGLFLAAGWSGSGFALAPAAGDLLARLALGRDPGPTLLPELRPGRFRPPS